MSPEARERASRQQQERYAYLRKWMRNKFPEPWEIKEYGMPHYRFPCVQCPFRGVSEGALTMHYDLKHGVSS